MSVAFDLIQWVIYVFNLKRIMLHKISLYVSSGSTSDVAQPDAHHDSIVSGPSERCARPLPSKDDVATDLPGLEQHNTFSDDDGEHIDVGIDESIPQENWTLGADLPDAHLDDIELRKYVGTKSLKDWTLNQAADPSCCAAIKYLTLRCPTPFPAFILDSDSKHSKPNQREFVELATKGDLLETEQGLVLLINRKSNPHAKTSLLVVMPGY